jgi:hypothetical protein
MAFPIIPKKRSGATGSPTSLTVGELAVNTATGELFLGGDSAVLLLNPPTAAGTTATERTGDGTTTAFTFTGYNGTADGGYLVSVGGIDQPPSKYAVSSTAGGTITFVEAPTAGELISIRALVASGGGGGGSGTVTSITAGTGLDGGTITESGTISMPDVGTPQTAVGGGLVIPVISTDAQGRVTALTTAANPALMTTQIAGLSTTAPAALSTSAVVGLSTFAARADHQHVFPTAAQVGALGATATASGDLTGAYPGPTLAAITTAQSNVGSSTQIPIISIDAKGRITSLSTAAAIASGNATQLQGVNISATPPADAQYLAYNLANLQWEPTGGLYQIEYILIAGGGSGGGGGGGGGAGGLIAGTTQAAPGQVNAIVIGAGGANITGTGAGNNGSNSSAFGLIAIGGGSSGAYLTNGSVNGLPGGSGGGCGLSASGTNHLGGAGTSGQGFAGGNNPLSANVGGYVTGGGGGAAAVGGDRVSSTQCGAGGAGALNAINGSSLYWAGGGGGGGQSNGSGVTGGAGGIGGGGGGAAGTPAAAGTKTGGAGGGSALNNGTAGQSAGNNGGAGGANTGGGGGGNAGSVGTTGAGGSGIFILRYLGAQRGSGGTVTSSGGYTIHTFLSSGNYIG